MEGLKGFDWGYEAFLSPCRIIAYFRLKGLKVRFVKLESYHSLRKGFLVLSLLKKTFVVFSNLFQSLL